METKAGKFRVAEVEGGGREEGKRENTRGKRAEKRSTRKGKAKERKNNGSKEAGREVGNLG